MRTAYLYMDYNVFLVTVRCSFEKTRHNDLAGQGRACQNVRQVQCINSDADREYSADNKYILQLMCKKDKNEHCRRHYCPQKKRGIASLSLLVCTLPGLLTLHGLSSWLVAARVRHRAIYVNSCSINSRCSCMKKVVSFILYRGDCTGENYYDIDTAC